MSTPDLATPLTQQELDRLEALLDSDARHGEAMPLDALQGLFFAVASGPDLIMPSHWMPAALGENPEFASEKEAQEAIGLLMRFYNQAVAEVAKDGFQFILYGAEDGAKDFATWCAGYLDGVGLSDIDWFDRGDPDEVGEMLYPFMVLAGELPAKERRAFKPAEWRSLVKACEDGLADAIVDVRDYWNALRAPPQTVRRATRKTGRNDPCPCGSGKKFKQCCGAPGKLH
jgi:uncharacterized protein